MTNIVNASDSSIVFPYRITASRLAALDEARQKIMRIGERHGLIIIENEQPGAGKSAS